MKANVLELVGSFQQGGSERQAVQLSRLLNASGAFNVFVATLDRSGELRQQIDWLGDDLLPEYKLTSFYDLRFISQLRRCASFLKTQRIDIVHTHDFYSNIFGMLAARMARVPVRIASKRETYSKTNGQMLLERQAFRLADRIVVNAAAVYEFLIKTGVSAKKPVVIHNGIDATGYCASSDCRPPALSKLGLSQLADKRIVTIVANLRSNVKNHSMFLRSAKMVADSFGDAAFVIAGEGELMDALRKEAASLGLNGSVHFIGACSNVPALLLASDVCILSSRSEGFSNAILEYMAGGKPVVATRVGGAAEAVVEKETGYLVDPDDDRSMSKCIAELLADPCKAQRFGEAGRRRVANSFSIDAQLQKTVDLYEHLLETKRPALH